MRVGFVTQLLWPRYGPFWLSLIQGLGVEVAFAEPERVARFLADPRVSGAPGLAFRLAAAQAIALQGCDFLVVPDLNPGPDVPRGGGQDPWIASFPETLSASVSGLPPTVPVSATLEGELERRAVEVLTLLGRDPAGVRRVWQRYRATARTSRLPEPRWQRQVGERETVGLLAQPWLLSDELSARLEQPGVHRVSQHRLAPILLREEGWRLESRLVATDAEVLGAARLLGRRGSVSRLELLVDPGSGADHWLERQVKKLVHKPLSVRSLAEALPDGDPLALLQRP